MTDIILKRRPFLVRLWRSYKGMPAGVSRYQAARFALTLSACGTNLAGIVDRIVRTTDAVGYAWQWLALNARIARVYVKRAFSAPAAGLFWAGVSFSTAIDCLVRGEALPFVAWLAWAGLVLGLACRLMRADRAARDKQTFERGVITGVDMERARAADTPGNVGARIGRLVAGQVNDILKKERGE